MISIIIPTFNRCSHLKKTLHSLSNIIAKHEVLVVDNNSTDHTKSVVLNFANTTNKRVKYVFEPEPGLLFARHTGYRRSNGEVLAYLDDDVIVGKNWINGITETFSDNNVKIAGGPSFPSYECPPPYWLESLWSSNGFSRQCYYLSLIDQGKEIIEVDPTTIWGLNYSIRKDTLKELGGFHPDCTPNEMQYLQGDGETGLSLKAMEKKMKTIYHPEISVKHVIPRNRLKHSYFKKRMYYEGICRSFYDHRNAIRNESSNRNCTTVDVSYVQKILSTLSNRISAIKKKLSFLKIDFNHKTSETSLEKSLEISLLYGYKFHANMVARYPKLIEWVTMDNYLSCNKNPVIIKDHNQI